MDIINIKTNYSTTKAINGETVNYLSVSAMSICLYFLLSRIFYAFFEQGIAKGIGLGIVAIVSYFLMEKTVFIKSKNRIIIKIGAFLGQCIIDLGILYLFISFLQPKTNMSVALVGGIAVAITLFINYFFSKKIVFKDCIDATKRSKGRLYKCAVDNRFVLLSCGIATFIMLFVYFCYSSYPFGDNTVLRMDLYHQYGPLFTELYDRLKGGESLIYSWQSGGGSAFIGNFFNYLSSPLSLLVLFFEREAVPSAISIIILVKAVLSAGSFTLYLKLSHKKSSFVTAGFGLLYAFCGFFLAYYWNLMWLDALYLLPMIAFGIEQIINRKKPTLYLVSLVITMVSNYYMAYIVCIFSALYFLLYFFSNHSITSKFPPKKLCTDKNKGQNRFVTAGIIFGVASIVAACLCAVTLLPTYQALQSSSATAGTFPTDATSYFKFLDFFSNHFAAIDPTIRSSGGDVLPNIYSGVIVLILIPLYMLNSKIRMREKFMHILILALLIVSFNSNILNYIWHAFHFPNDLPYRFSFIYTFIILTMAFRLLMNFKSIKPRDIMYVGMLVALFVVVSEKTPTKYFKDEMTFYVTIAFTLIYVGILILAKKKTLVPYVTSLLLLLTISTEIVVGSTDSYVISQSLKSYTGDYAEYDKIFEKIDEREKSKKSFYRTELTHLKTRMDPSLYGYNGMSTFSSMAYADYSQLQYSLGMFGNRINSFTYNPQTPVYNSMFALKYFVNNSDANLNNEFYRELFSNRDNSMTVYENKYFLPIAFCANPTILGWEKTEGNPFSVQNSFIQNASGVNDVFTPLKFRSTYFENVEPITFTENGTFNYTKINESDNGYVTIEITAKSDANIYIYASSPSADEMNVVFGEENDNYNFNEPYIYDLGSHKTGDKITAKINVGTNKESSVTFYAYQIEMDRFETAYDYLSNGGITIEESDDTSIIGRVTANDNSILYTSIPYDKGWEVFVDGVKTKTMKIGDSMLGVSVSKGSHDIEMKFTPSGLTIGATVSTTTIVGLALISTYLIVRYNKKKKSV